MKEQQIYKVNEHSIMIFQDKSFGTNAMFSIGSILLIIFLVVGQMQSKQLPYLWRDREIASYKLGHGPSIAYYVIYSYNKSNVQWTNIKMVSSDFRAIDGPSFSAQPNLTNWTTFQQTK